MRRALAAAGTLMQTALSLRAAVRPEVASRVHPARRLSAVRAVGGHTPPFRGAVAASPARQAVVARDSITSLETYSDAPPLEVVPWSKEALNTVMLTGTVGAVDVRRLASGKTKATLRLAVRKPMPGGADPETDWFDVDVWNELAEQVAEHAPKGSKLVVSGKLVQDKWSDKETGKPRTAVRVLAFNVAALEPYRNDAMGEESSKPAPMRTPAAKPVAAAPAPVAAAPAKSKPATGSMTSQEKEAQYLDLLYYPQNWFDNRPQEPGSKRPDFKHKATDLALWLEEPGRPSKLPQYVADYMGHRFQNPAPQWEPPQDNGGAPPAPDAGASPF